MSRALVTGATGFVGANLTRRLLADGHEVHILVRPEHAVWRIRDMIDRLRVHAVDLSDSDGTRGEMARVAPDWVFHLAVYGAYPAQSDVGAMVKTNVLGTVNVVQAAIECGTEVIVNTGSSSEYGFKSSAPAESEPAQPNSEYAVTKLSATLLCQEMARRSGTRVPTLRLYSVYGPYEEPTRFLPTLVLHALEGRLPPLASPHTARDFVYVDDVVEAYLCAARQPHSDPGAIFNVGTGRQSSLADAVELVRGMFGIPKAPKWGSYADRYWDTATWVADPGLIQRELGWSARTSLSTGLQAFADWFNRHPQYRQVYLGQT